MLVRRREKSSPDDSDYTNLATLQDQRSMHWKAMSSERKRGLAAGRQTRSLVAAETEPGQAGRHLSIHPPADQPHIPCFKDDPTPCTRPVERIAALDIYTSTSSRLENEQNQKLTY